MSSPSTLETTLLPEMQTQVFGKWILAGEHAVLRGCPALVFPVFGKSLRLSFFEVPQPLSAEFGGECGEELRLLFWGVLERALETLQQPRAQLTGRFLVESSVPVGAGLGASATLCVAVSRWLSWKGWISEAQLYEFSRQLENLFHGESSGVDIAVALTAKGLRFERSGHRSEVEPRWNPYWYISYSGKRGVTSECVARVKRMWESDHTYAQMIDADMKSAVLLAEESLGTNVEAVGFEKLTRAIRLASTCFDRWGLADGEMGLHLRRLEEAGAVAVKPTGSGDGGFALSLWKGTPPDFIRSILIPLELAHSPVGR